MKNNPKLSVRTTESLAARIADLLYSRIENNEEEFLRESDLYMLIDETELIKESTNEIFFYINDIFGFNPPMMKYKYIESKLEGYEECKERAFEFRYGSDLEELASIVNAIKYSEKKLEKELDKDFEYINCIAKSPIYKDIYIITVLNSKSRFTENKLFVFNSFYTNINEGEILNINQNDYKNYLINDKEVCYNANELSEYEMSLLNKHILIE